MTLINIEQNNGNVKENFADERQKMEGESG
jgi:hypothetical protein